MAAKEVKAVRAMVVEARVLVLGYEWCNKGRGEVPYLLEVCEVVIGSLIE